MTSNFPDEICESEKAAHIFAEIKDAKVREEIEKMWKVESEKLCAQRKADFIVKELAFGKMGEIIEKTIEQLPAESVDGLNEHKKYFNEKIAELAKEEQKRFGIRKAQQVRGGFNKMTMEFLKLIILGNILDN
jgi:hypothetical protein